MISTATRTDDVRELLHRFIDEVINGRDLDQALSALVAEEFVEHNPLPGQGPGRAGLADVLALMFAAFPDLVWTIHETVVEDDRIMAFSTWTGTHRGDFLGRPASGREVTVEAWTLDRYHDGQMTDSRIIMDVAALLGQIGARPAPTGP
jgi:steroid delta-isomerase-like uncharacterized protein